MKEDPLESYLNYSHKVESRWWLSGNKQSELTQLPQPGRDNRTWSEDVQDMATEEKKLNWW